MTDHETFELNNKSCGLKLSVSYVPLIKEMKTSKKYGGYDKNWVSLGRSLKEAGATCMSGKKRNL